MSDDGRVADAILDLVEADPRVVHGQARFRGTRIPVTVVLDNLAAGVSEAEIRRQYPTLPEGAIRAALAYAAHLAHDELYPLEPTEG
jgi:uncharacterized protein (DUF433 family)